MQPLDCPESLVQADQPQAIRREHQTEQRQFSRRLSAALDGALQGILALAVLGELGVVLANIVSREFFDLPLLWTQEAAEMALTTIAFLGGALAYRRGGHAAIRMVIEALPVGPRQACEALLDLIVLSVAVTTGLSSLTLFVARWEQLTPILYMRVSWFGLPLLVCMVVLAVTAIERLGVRHRAASVLQVGVPFGALVLLLVLTKDTWRPWLAGAAPLALALGLFFITVLIGLPVGFSLLLGAIGYLYVKGTVSMVALAHNMVNGVGNFVLLALPFFILAGVVMNEGGISLRLVRFVRALVGHFRGGLFQVMVVSMYIVSGLSGSKPADVAAVGSVMRDMLRQEGYSLDEATAVLAASAVMGETVPPSIAVLVLASVTTLSIGALFIGGLIPAVVIAIAIMVLIYVRARRWQVLVMPRVTLRELAKATCGGILPLLMPVILFGGILLGVATPTEVSTFAVIYGIALAGFVYRELKFRTLVRGLIDTAAVSGMLLFILGSASSFSYVLTVAQLPHRLVRLMSDSHGGSQWVFMLASIALLVVTGAVLEGLPALLILAPILMPMASLVGVSQLHYGIVLVIAMGIGAFSPPVGVGFYVTCAICETTIEKAGRAMIPYVVVLIIGLLVVALVPWFTLYLPGVLHLAR